MKSVQDFDILARNHWRYSTEILFQSEDLREEWEPCVNIADRIPGAARSPQRAQIPTWVKSILWLIRPN